MNHQELKDFLAERYGDGIVILEPEYYDEAIVGTDQAGRLIYSYEKLIETISSHDGMTYEDAMEWVDYNTLRAIPYMGEFAPIIMFDLDY